MKQDCGYVVAHKNGQPFVVEVALKLWDKADLNRPGDAVSSERA